MWCIQHECRQPAIDVLGHFFRNRKISESLLMSSPHRAPFLPERWLFRYVLVSAGKRATYQGKVAKLVWAPSHTAINFRTIDGKFGHIYIYIYILIVSFCCYTFSSFRRARSFFFLSETRTKKAVCQAPSWVN